MIYDYMFWEKVMIQIKKCSLVGFLRGGSHLKL